MKNTLLSFLFFFFLFNSILGQDWFSIVGKSPYPQDVKVYFTGFNGFGKVDVGSIRTTSGGEIDFFTDYHGFCIMKAEGGKAYPLILEHDPVCLEWGDVPKFPCDPENAFYYGKLGDLQYLDSLLIAYKSAPDSLEDKRKLKESLDLAFETFVAEINDAEPLNANAFLLSELMIREVKMVEDAEQMILQKEGILSFVSDHFAVLNKSDYINKLAGAYLEMNKAVFNSDVSIHQAMEYDVDIWVKSLGPVMGEKEVVNFFLLYSMKANRLELASKLADKYIDLVKCEQFVSDKLRPVSMPYTFNVFFGPEFSSVRSLDQFQGIQKVLALFSTECPASVAAITGLYDFVTENQIRLPVILVPDYEMEGELAVLVEEKAPFGLQTGFKTGSSLMLGAGIKQLPAFMVLDRKNLLQEIFYDLDGLKALLKGSE